MAHQNLALPVIDLTLLDDPNKLDNFYETLRSTARNIGFFYLVGHGLDPTSLLSAMKTFFALPLGEKNHISINGSRHFRGYMQPLVEQTRNIPDNREQIDIGEELPPVEDISEAEPWLHLIGPNQWSERVPELRDAALEYQHHVRCVALKLLKAFLVALKVPEHSFNALIDGTPQSFLKLVHYPPCNEGIFDTNKEQGCGAHKDNGFLTLLWQDEVGGLQVETDQGWIDVPPLKGAYVVNIGEVLEQATAGYLIANVHRVVRHATSGSRYSIPFFLLPDVRVPRVPVLELPDDLAKLSRGLSVDPLNPLFDGVGKNILKGRLRSYREAAKQFYPRQYQQIVDHGTIL